MPPARPNLLLAFDAFGTLFKPRSPVATQYAEVARRLGLEVSELEVEKGFKDAFKRAAIEKPNYGKAVGMDAKRWWGEVITETFRPYLKEKEELPTQLVPELIKRFSSGDGYTIFPDVIPFFQLLRENKKRITVQKSQNSNQLPDSSLQGEKQQVTSSWPWNHTIVGIITNSDDRVPGILTSLGVHIGHRRVKTPVPRQTQVVSGGFGNGNDDDVDFIVLSYDVGFEKPDQRIFDAAVEMLHESTFPGVPGSQSTDKLRHRTMESEWERLYIGDELKKDYLGAKNAGWNALLLDRENAYEKRGLSPISETEIASSTEKEDKVKVINSLDALRYWTP